MSSNRVKSRSDHVNNAGLKASLVSSDSEVTFIVTFKADHLQFEW